MELSDNYKNIVKLRFDSPEKLDANFFELFYEGIKNPENFDGEIFKSLPLSVILRYLKKSHTEYLTLWFPKIEGLAKDLQREIGINDVTMTLHSFIVNYYNELSNHINFEEKVLYNFVEKLLNGTYVEKEKMFVLNHFLETHSHAVSDDLGTIKKVLLNKDTNFLNNKKAIDLFDQLSIVQNDLALHGIIEDEVFIEKTHQYISKNY
jgi:regulator of cell morphogenesis and NO signaling